MTHMVHLEIEIVDPKLLREVALVVAKACRMTEQEFCHVEAVHYAGDPESYWLRWIFQLSPGEKNYCGVTIEDSYADLLKFNC